MKKNALIIGDSYSTFGGFVPEGNKVYYAEIPTHDTDVLSVTDTWWYQVITEGNFNLVLNESWSGAPVGYRGYDGEDCSKTSSFIYRLRLMRERGFFRDNEIHTVFAFGGTNDSWCEAPLGEIKCSDWKEEDLYYVLPAICCFFRELRQCLPEAEIYCLINTDLKEEITQALLLACKNHHMIPVTFPHIHKTNDHPTVLGMRTIKETVMAAIEEQSHG